MLIDSVAYKDHIWSIREKHGGGLERDNVLLHFVALLVEEGGEIEWPEEILKRREWNCERKQPLESTEGLVYSLSGPGVRKKRLVEAEARLGIRGLEFGGVKRRVALRPELRLSIKKSTSMEAMVGGTPRNNHEMSIESPCSDDDEREDAHIDSLRLALAAMSHHSPPAPSRTSTNNFALASAIAPTPDSARDKASWEPISALDQQQEELDRQRSREESRGEEWGTDSEGSNGSEDIDDETNGGKRREEEIEEARKLAGNGERVKKKERTSSEKEKEKTSIAESFPGRSFF
jgi:hypothetical protein